MDERTTPENGNHSVVIRVKSEAIFDNEGSRNIVVETDIKKEEEDLGEEGDTECEMIYLVCEAEDMENALEEEEGQTAENEETIRDEVEMTEYRCGKCYLYFDSFTELGLHIRKKHTRKFRTSTKSVARKRPKPETYYIVGDEQKGEELKIVRGNDEEDRDSKADDEDYLVGLRKKPREVKMSDSLIKHRRKLQKKALKKKNVITKSKSTSKSTTYWCNRCFLFFPTFQKLIEHRRSPRHFLTTRCDICGKQFKYVYLMQLHRNQHRENSQRLLADYKCLPCERLYHTFGQLLIHYTEVHEQDKQCILCGEQMSHVLGMKRHLRSHRKRMYKCLPCDRIFSSNDELKLHYHTEDHKQCKKCPWCFKEFPFATQMRMHLRIHHTKDRPHQCEVCGQRFTLFSLMKAHRYETHMGLGKTYLCEYCGTVIKSRAGFHYHRKCHKKSPKEACYLCMKLFPNDDSLQEHQEQVHLLPPNVKGDQSIACKLCTEKMNSATFAFKHYLIMHNFFWCYRCNYTHESRQRLERHLKAHEVFSGDEEADDLVLKESELDDRTCPVCQRTFKYRSTLRYHMYCHTGEKPYQCTVCEKTFRKPYHVKLHMTTHTGEYLHCCDVCGAKYNQKSMLTQHMTTHELEFICSVCHRKFKTKEGCQAHLIKYHSREHEEGQAVVLEYRLPEDAIPRLPKQRTAYNLNSDTGTNDATAKKLGSFKRPPPGTEFKCEHCIRSFKSQNACDNHSKKYHPQANADVSEISLMDYLDPRRIDCKYCERYFKSQVAHDNHMVRAHPQQAGIVFVEEDDIIEEEIIEDIEALEA